MSVFLPLYTYLFIFSGARGSGKSTLCKELLLPLMGYSHFDVRAFAEAHDCLNQFDDDYLEQDVRENDVS